MGKTHNISNSQLLKFLEEMYLIYLQSKYLPPITFKSIYFYLSTVACKSLGTPCRICENVNSFNKIREIIQNACYFLFSTVLSKIFYIKYVYI